MFLKIRQRAYRNRVAKYNGAPQWLERRAETINTLFHAVSAAWVVFMVLELALIIADKFGAFAGHESLRDALAYGGLSAMLFFVAAEIVIGAIGIFLLPPNDVETLIYEWIIGIGDEEDTRSSLYAEVMASKKPGRTVRHMLRVYRRMQREYARFYLPPMTRDVLYKNHFCVDYAIASRMKSFQQTKDFQNQVMKEFKEKNEVTNEQA